MKTFTTFDHPGVLFGEGTSRQIGKELKKNNVKNVLVFYDKGVYEAGLIAPIIKVIEEEEIQVVRYDKVIADPPDYIIEDARNVAVAQDIDAIVGIGGGSTLDTAKLIATYMEGTPPVAHYYSDGGEKPYPLPVRWVKLYLIPTTAGTGSEVTGVSVITDTKAHAKRTIWGDRSFMADLAIVDPCLMVGLPPYITASTAMDAMAHSLETMTSNLRNAMSDTLCGQAVEYISRSLPKAYENGSDMEARSELAMAAWLALAAGGSRHLGHCIGHAIGARYHIAHGHACALVLPTAMRYVAPDAQKEMAIIADKMKLEVKPGENAGEMVALALEKMNKQLGLRTLKEMGIAFDDFCEVLPEIMKDEKYLSKLDRRPDETTIKNILRNVYEGGN